MSATTPTLSFTIPLDANPALVEELIQMIRRTFQVRDAAVKSGTDPVDAAVHDLTGELTPGQAQAAQQQNNQGPLVEGTDEDGPRDVHGWPHNSQIHASTKGTTNDGAWRARSRVDDATRTRVQNEMIKAYGLTLPNTNTDAGNTAPPQQSNTPPGPPRRPGPPPSPGSTTPNAKPEFTALTSFIATAQQENPDLTDEWLGSVYEYYKAVDANGAGSLAAVAALDADTIKEIHSYVADTHAEMMGS